MPIEKVVSQKLPEMRRALQRHPAVWLEWGDEQAVELTQRHAEIFRGRRVFLRIHHYEVVTGLAEGINYKPISDLIFVCRDMRDRLLERLPALRQQVERIHVIPNGVDLRRYQLIPRQPGHNLGFIGFLNHKKGPMELMYALRALHSHDPRFRLHVAGLFQDNFYLRACTGFLDNHALNKQAVFYGWVADIAAWLANIHFIICTSLSESQGMGLMEAMATGCQPLIYHFPRATGIYPRQVLWDNLEELVEAAGRPHDPAGARAFVERNYSLDRQIESLSAMLAGQEVVFAGPVLAESSPALY